VKKVNKKSLPLRENSLPLRPLFCGQTASSLHPYRRSGQIICIGSNRWPQVIPRELNVTGIDSNYFLLLISVDVCLGSPVLGSHNTEEEVAHYRNHAQVSYALYLQLDWSSFVFPFLSSLFSSNPWLSTAETLAASGRLLGLPIMCYDHCGGHEPCKPTFKSAKR